MIKKISFFIFSFIVYAHYFSPVYPVETIVTQEQLEEQLVAQAQQDMFEEEYNKLIQILEAIDNSLEHLALVVNNNQVRHLNTKELKREALSNIFEIRRHIDQKKKNRVMTVTLEDYAHLTKNVLAILQHVHTMIAQGLKNVEPFHDAPLIRSGPVSLENIQKDLQEVTQLSKTLEQKANNIGLSIINRAFRTLEKWDHKYKLKRKFLWGLGLTIAASYIIYKLHPSYFEKFPFWKHDDDDFPTDDSSLNLPPSKPPVLPQPSMPPATTQALDPNTMTREQLIDFNLRVKTQKNMLKVAELVKHGAAVNVEDLPWIKRVLGDPYDAKARGIWNHIETVLTARLQLVAFSSTMAWFVLPEYLKEPVTDWLKTKWEWTKKRMSVIASYLRGGPVKKMLIEFEREPKATFDDVIGNDEAKLMLAQIVDYIVNYIKRDRSGIIPTTGVLFIGAPRTGKSFLAEALAGEIKRISQEQIRMLDFTAAELKAIGITKLFALVQEAARETGPVILLVDEIDTGGFLRIGENADNEALCELLTALSNLNRQKSNKIVVIACTNKPENIDPALLEPGRFGIHIYFIYPTEEQRKEFIIRELTNRTIYIEPEFIDKLAHMTQGVSFDALNQLLTTALQRAKMRGTTLTKEDLEQAYYQEINRIVFTEIAMPEAEQHIVALHQAGEALARILLNTRKQANIITTYAVNPDITQNTSTEDINSRNLKKNKMQYGKVFTIIEKNTATGEFKGDVNEISLPKFFTHADYIHEIKVLLAGAAAESIVNGSTSYIYQQQNREKALDIAKYITLKGMPDNGHYPNEYKEQKLAEALTIIEQCEQDIKQLLSEHTDELITLANELHTNKLLTSEEITDILEQTDDQADDNSLSIDDLLEEESIENEN